MPLLDYSTRLVYLAPLAAVHFMASHQPNANDKIAPPAGGNVESRVNAPGSFLLRAGSQSWLYL